MKTFKGGITVFLSLVLAVLLGLLFTVIEAARDNGADFQTECVADMALQSALAEYHREVLEQYDLFFVDIGYGTEEGGYILLEEHLKEYMQKNFCVEDDLYIRSVKDLLRLTADTIVVTEASGAADLDGSVMEREAVDYMLDRYGLLDGSVIQTIFQTVEDEGFLENSMEEKRLANERAIDDVDTTVEDEDGKKHKIPVNNPADAVNSRRGSLGILKTVTRKEGISDQEVNLQEYISHRNYIERDGFLQGETRISGVEDLLFQKYLMEKCGCYSERKENSYLTYQMEYLLAGKNTDLENLRYVVNRLLVLREAANFLYLLSDSKKQAEAETLAMTVAAVTLFPELKDLVKLSILIGWAYGESVNDVTILLEGGKVPLLKSSESWRLSLENALRLRVDDGMERSGEGLSYQEYLHALLSVMDRKIRNFRFMDLMEMDIRQTEGNETFCMDHCIHGFRATIMTHSDNGHDCMIKRTVSYCS